jgi:hypothetical protein
MGKGRHTDVNMEMSVFSYTAAYGGSHLFSLLLEKWRWRGSQFKGSLGKKIVSRVL